MAEKGNQTPGQTAQPGLDSQRQKFDQLNRQSKVGKAFVQGKMEKYGITRKSAYSILSLLACIALIVVLSVTRAYFDPHKLETIEYWVSLMIQVAICIFGMISGKQAGGDVAMNTPNGRYSVSLRAYSLVIGTIKELGLYAYIGDWLENYRQRKLDEKIRMVLGDVGIRQMEVLDLDFQELDNLRTAGWEKNWDGTPFRAKYWDEKEQISHTYFVSYTEHQINVIRAVKEGKVKVSPLPSTFFVSAFSESERDEWESSANAAKRKGMYLGVNYGYRIIGMSLFSIMITGLQVMATAGDETAKMEMLLSMVSNIGTLIMSYLWGVAVGYNIVKIDNDYIDFKASTMTLMVDEYKIGTYKIKSVEEQAKDAHEKRVKASSEVTTIAGETAHDVKAR
jgi:hypothetical protein